MNKDVLIIGAGASGLMCAIEAAKRGRQVCVIDHAPNAGQKIRISGGGRCNFTNYQVEPHNYLSNNPHFCRSALKRYTQWDFIDWMQRGGIAYHEREHGQLFCDDSAQQIVDLLIADCKRYGVEIRLATALQGLQQREQGGFSVATTRGTYQVESLVVATGGLSVPKVGASPLGYQIAEQFGIKVWPTRAGLVPLTLQPAELELLAPLAGIAVPCTVTVAGQSFTENLLFTHRGLSGPVILQISNYWQPGMTLTINWLPQLDMADWLQQQRQSQGKRQIKTLLGDLLPKRLLPILVEADLLERRLAECSQAHMQRLQQQINAWPLKPNGSEGYRKAEVTLGGVDCDALSSKTMESLAVKGLYFVGEVVDVTGWLGGYNLQWAWASGWCAGQFV